MTFDRIILRVFSKYPPLSKRLGQSANLAK